MPCLAYLGVVAHEAHAVARVHGAGAEVALEDPHGCLCLCGMGVVRHGVSACVVWVAKVKANAGWADTACLLACVGGGGWGGPLLATG